MKGNGLLLMSGGMRINVMRRFFVSNIELDDGKIKINSIESYHAQKVLRLKNGEMACIFDGIGNEYIVKLLFSENSATGEIVETITNFEYEPSCSVTLAFSVLKGEKNEFIIQKGVELGVSDFIPMLTERGVRIPGNAEKLHTRWQRIAAEASKQCGRNVVPTINEIKTISQVIDDIGEYDLCICPHEMRPENASVETVLSEIANKEHSSILLLIGPEGGFSDNDTFIMKSAGIDFFSLGKRILRSETAALAAVALIMYETGNMS